MLAKRLDPETSSYLDEVRPWFKQLPRPTSAFAFQHASLLLPQLLDANDLKYNARCLKISVRPPLCAKMTGDDEDEPDEHRRDGQGDANPYLQPMGELDDDLDGHRGEQQPE